MCVDVNTAYQQAARSVLIENEALLQRFKMTVTTSTPTPSAPTPTPMDRSELIGCIINIFVCIHCVYVLHLHPWTGVS